MSIRPVVVIGGGPGGLATAAALAGKGIPSVVLERGDAVGTSWRNHYERLHLHTPRSLSHLPGFKIPAAEGRWVSRAGVVRYLEDYAAHHGLEVRTGVSVRRVDRAADQSSGAPRWVVRTDGGSGDIETDTVVVATGYNHTPFVPDWPGLDTFTGEVVHASRYRTGATYAGRDVLVVGAGNTGAEISVDLVEQGARKVWLAYRRPPYVLKRSEMGVPTTYTGVLMRHVPAAIADVIAEPVRRKQPSLVGKGIPDPGKGVYTRAKRGEIPILDVGFVDAVLNDRVTPVPEVVAFDGSKVVLVDDTRIDPEVVVVAAGYRRGLEPLVGHLGVLAETGRPSVHGPRTAPHAPGLHFIGYTNPVSGMFREMNIDARRIARSISRNR